MVDLDSDPTKLLEVIAIGKQLLITRGSITTFSIANDVAKYFAIVPGAVRRPSTRSSTQLNVMGLATPQSAILSAVIFNALVIVALIPLALRGVGFRAAPASELLRRNLLDLRPGRPHRPVRRHQAHRHRRLDPGPGMSSPVSTLGCFGSRQRGLEGAVFGRVRRRCHPASSARSRRPRREPGCGSRGGGRCPGRWPRRRAVAAQGLAWLESPAKSQTASRSSLSTAQRNVTARCLPDCLVEGATPARQARDAASGNRPRASPISASSRAARTVPVRGRAGRSRRRRGAASCSADLRLEDADLLDQAVEHGEQGAGDVGPGGAVGSDRCPGVRPAGRAGGRRGPCGRCSRRWPARSPAAWSRASRPVPGGRSGPGTARLIGESSSRNRSTAPGKVRLQVGAELVAQRDAVRDQVPTGPHSGPQRPGGLGVVGQRPQPGPVGAHGVGQHVGVEPVVLVARRAVPRTEVLELVGADDDDGQPGAPAAPRPPGRRRARWRPRPRHAGQEPHHRPQARGGVLRRARRAVLPTAALARARADRGPHARHRGGLPGGHHRRRPAGLPDPGERLAHHAADGRDVSVPASSARRSASRSTSGADRQRPAPTAMTPTPQRAPTLAPPALPSSRA